MSNQPDNRYREYRITVPAVIAAEIKRRAKEQKTTEAVIVRQLIAKGLVTVGSSATEVVTE